MALSPTLRQMVANAQARYSEHHPADDECDFAFSVTQQLVELAFRKATKKDLLQIVRRAAMAT